MNPLSSARRSELRAAAHKLTPVVIVGDKGLTDEVMAEVERSLNAHELIKVRAATDDRAARNVWMESICEKLAAHPVQQIGKVLVIYRENPKEAVAAKPRRSPALGEGQVPRAGDRGRRPQDAGKDRVKAKGRVLAKPKTGLRRSRTPDAEALASKRTARPRSRTPSPRPESEPRRRRPRTSR
jgi:putative YhbY family RNA-binding protein